MFFKSVKKNIFQIFQKIFGRIKKPSTFALPNKKIEAKKQKVLVQ